MARLIFVAHPLTGGCAAFTSDDKGHEAAARELRRVRGGKLFSVDAEEISGNEALVVADAPIVHDRDAIMRGRMEKLAADREALRRSDTTPDESRAEPKRPR